MRAVLVSCMLLILTIATGGWAGTPVTGRDWFEAVPEMFSPRAGAVVVNFNNKLWLLGGNDGGLRRDAWASADGKQWTRTSGKAFSTRQDFAAVAFNGRIRVLGGYRQAKFARDRQYYPEIWSTADGINWTTSPITVNPPVNYTPALRDGQGVAEFNGYLWVIGGFCQLVNSAGWDVYFNDVWRSVDGTNWQRIVEHAPFTARRGHAAVVFKNRLWVIGGDGRRDVWSSANGITWTSATLQAEFPPLEHPACAVFQNKLWLLGKYNEKIEMWNSADGIHWAKVNTAVEFPAGGRYAMAVKGGELWAIGGMAESTWHSADGIHWTGETIRHPGVHYGAQYLFHGGKLWMFGGKGADGQSRNEIWSTPDGTHWTRVVNGTAILGYSCLAFGGKMWLLGYNQAWTSVDGVKWDGGMIASVNELFYTSFVHDGQIWVTKDSRVWNSPDGLQWTVRASTLTTASRTTLASYSYKHLLWNAGFTYATLPRPNFRYPVDNDIWNSTDGVTWRRVAGRMPFTLRTSYLMQVFDNRMWMIAGGTDDRLTYREFNDVWQSDDGASWTQATAQAAFPARMGHSSVVMGNKMWIFGGQNKDGYLSDAWYTVGSVPAAVAKSWTQYR